MEIRHRPNSKLRSTVIIIMLIISDDNDHHFLFLESDFGANSGLVEESGVNGLLIYPNRTLRIDL